jgi:uncharacterized protein YecA (UPF0149 family)
MGQDLTGRMNPISEQNFLADVAAFGKKARVVEVGDKFEIRGCRFQVTSITPDGIEARGVPHTQPQPRLGIRPSHRIGRNEACPCNSGKKYKFCCMA